LIFLISTAVSSLVFFFYNATSPPAIYTLSLHDALPISLELALWHGVTPPLLLSVATVALTLLLYWQRRGIRRFARPRGLNTARLDRKSTRLNSSHVKISYAVFCLKKKNIIQQEE